MTDRKERGRLACSFLHALEGIWHTFRRERNMQIHGWAALWAALLGLWAELSWWKYLLILFAILWVWAMELINTAIEHAVDLAASGPHPLAKRAKDAAAGAVVLSALFAALLGLTFLWGPMRAKVEALHIRFASLSLPRPALLVLMAVWLFLLVLLASFRRRKGKEGLVAWAAYSLFFFLYFRSRSPDVQLVSLFLPVAANLVSRRGWGQLAGLLEMLFLAGGMFLLSSIIA